MSPQEKGWVRKGRENRGGGKETGLKKGEKGSFKIITHPVGGQRPGVIKPGTWAASEK